MNCLQYCGNLVLFEIPEGDILALRIATASEIEDGEAHTKAEDGLE